MPRPVKMEELHASMHGGGLRLRAQRWALLRLQRLTRRVSGREPLPAHLEVGLRGEFEALFFLRRLGFTVIERRWRTPELKGDVDLIAYEGETLCFVEVKTRSARDMTPAALAVDEPKRAMLREMAQAYVRTVPRESGRRPLLRFDVVSVYLLPAGVECELVRDAFPRR